MNANFKTLFEQQSYEDALSFYQGVLADEKAVTWDYVILTASNEAQAQGYLEQIAYRTENGQLPKSTHYAVLPDPEGKRVGSGGATLNALLYVKNRERNLGNEDAFRKKILLIHSGGDSKRVPQYSACGKLFSPVPRVLPDGRRSTLFDEFMIGMSTVVPRISAGALICSGDVLLLFNALQIDFYTKGAAALSIKEPVSVGKNHGVFLKDENANVGKFLHKQTEETLSQMGAVDINGNVDIDTGAVIFDASLLTDLCDLVEQSPKTYINETVRLSLYADFLYPLATEATLEQYYKETPEGDFSEVLTECRTKLWEVISPYSMKLIQLSPASFIHFGTTKELLKLMTEDMEQYRFLGWSSNIRSNVTDSHYAVSNSYVSRKAVIGKHSYIEDSYIHRDTVVGEHCVISGVTLHGETVPDYTVLHGLKLNNGKFVCRMYGVSDNPKENWLLGEKLSEPLWTKQCYPVCDTIEEAVKETLKVMSGKTTDCRLISLTESFAIADVTQLLPWQMKIADKVGAESVLQAIDDGVPAAEVNIEVTERMERYLIEKAEWRSDTSLSDFSKKIRIYYYLYILTKNSHYLEQCFQTVSRSVYQSINGALDGHQNVPLQKEEVLVNLPVRVNWGGGWSDTPPYCMEHGGTVLNAAISFDGTLPIEVTVKRLKEHKIVLSSTDIGAYHEFTGDLSPLQNCRDPHDAFALHKAALIACDVIPKEGTTTVEAVCNILGGGLYFNTRVINIPKGSGLGTSSILATACVKALLDIRNISADDQEIYDRVLCMEQLMSTGGGWQDQVGGLMPGIKMVSSGAGMKQPLRCTQLHISDETFAELNARFCLIYTGQRRLARNLLREIVGNYIGNNPTSVSVLDQIQRVAVLMRFELEKGNVNGFAKLLNEHWELLKALDAGCTNTCIQQILYSVEDLIDGKMICGAGGGGFLQVVLKEGVSKDTIKQRLCEVFQDSGVLVYDCKFE